MPLSRFLLKTIFSNSTMSGSLTLVSAIASLYFSISGGTRAVNSSSMRLAEASASASASFRAVICSASNSSSHLSNACLTS